MPRLKKSPVKSLDKNTMGRNLRLIRMQKGFTQIDVAVKLNISQNGYSRIELGRTQLTLEVLILISDLFDMKWEDLIAEIVGDTVIESCV